MGMLLPKLVTFITLPLYTAVLTKSEYGTFDLISILVSLIAPAAILQIHSAVFRFLIGKKEQTEISAIITNVFVFAIPISFFLLVVVFFCLGTLGLLSRLLISIYLFLELYLLIIQQILRGLGKTKEYAISAIINTVANLVIVVPLLLWAKLGFDGLILSLCLALLISVGYISHYIQLYKLIDAKQISWACLKDLLRYSYPMVPNAASMWIMRVSDRLVISLFLGIEANAIYAVANKFSVVLSMAQNTFTLAWQESASLTNEDTDSEKYYSFVFISLFRALFGIMVLLIGLMPILFKLLIRGSYTEAYNQIPILVMAMLFFGLSAYYGGIYVAHKKTRSVAISTMWAAALNLVINLSLVHAIGLYAASLSTLISYIFLAIYRAIDSRKLRKLFYPYRSIGIYLFFATVVCVLYYISSPTVRCINAMLSCILALYANQRLLRKSLSILVRKKHAT